MLIFRTFLMWLLLSGIASPGAIVQARAASPQPTGLERSAPVHEEEQVLPQKAVEIAQHQAAKSLELRACTSLARLWQTQSKRTEARQLLSEIHAWFTEGFDTADLKEAGSLLNELT